MVKFGNHIAYYVANELDPTRRLYVVPYKGVQHRTCIESLPDQQQQVSPPPLLQLSTTSAAAPLQQQHPSSIIRSGLSKLFDNDECNSMHESANCCNLAPTTTAATAATTTTGALANPPEVKLPSNTNAITITTGTGAELAAAVKNILITQRQERHQQQQQQQQQQPRQRASSTSSMMAQEEWSNAVFEREEDDGLENNTEEGLQVNDSNAANTNMSEIDAEAHAKFFAQRFKTEWESCLQRATADFDRAMKLFWCEVFAGMKDYKRNDDLSTSCAITSYEMDETIRGALPDAALQSYVMAVPSERAHETFSFLKDIHATALINAEALRKLVKKFDKKIQHLTATTTSYLLSAVLLPEVYASNFTGSLASLEGGLALLRVLLNIEEDDSSPPLSSQLRKSASKHEYDMRDVAILREGYFGNKNGKETDDELVMKRKKELQWLRCMIESIDPIYVPFLVGHRGFHSIHDRSDVRPLENSLTAYEAAWTNGVHLCECDIALTKDERIILAHDENFARLGMDPTSPLCNRTVRDLTFQELMNCPLKSGARPPLLFDVLRSAAAIGGNAKMIVEIKAGNTDAASALARMFARHPKLMEHVAVVMSFDAFIMHNMRREMAAVFEQLHGSTHQQMHQQHGPAPPNYHIHGDKSPEPSRLPAPGLEYAVHPYPLPVLSNIALGSTLSSSPNLGPSILSRRPSHGLSLSSSPNLGPSILSRLPSHGRFPSILGSHNRLDSRDLFGLGHTVGSEKATDVGVGLNLADDGTPILSASNTFLPIHKQPDNEMATTEQRGPSSSPFVDKPTQTFPKLLLITVAETPKVDYELFVDFTQSENVEKLLRGGDGGSLDGVYMQYQKEMIKPEFSKAMRSLASRYDVGVWGTEPDEWDTFHTLVTECHVSYVNSSLPKHFLRKMKRSISANSLAMNGILSSHIGGMQA